MTIAIRDLSNHGPIPLSARAPRTFDLKAVKAGCPRAVRAFVEQHTPRMLRAAQRILRSRADAEDAVQDAFVNTFRNLASLEDGARLPGWMYRTAVNAAISLYRRRKRGAEEPIDPYMPQFDSDGWRNYPSEPYAANAEEQLMSHERDRAVRAAIDTLPENLRVVLVLRDLEGLSTREAAQALGIEETTLKVRLHRARTAMRTRIEPLWAASTGVAR